MTRHTALALAVATLVLAPALAAQKKKADVPNPIQKEYQAVADRIISAATADSAAWNKLAELTDGFGPRISGGEALERAIDWIIDRMKREGLANVRGEPAMVPRWIRGHEKAELLQPRYLDMPMLGLGMSVGTPKGGIEAEVLVVSSFAELATRGADAKGKIVLYDAPFVSYGATVQYRSSGANVASKLGAVGVLIRSVGPFGMRTPHTGAMAPYDSTTAKIPAAAISMEDAAMLHRMQARGQKVVVRLEMDAHQLPDSPSRNVMGELVGREKPDEVVVFGGHIDSWDVGTGAMDDAGGVVIAWEAVRLLKQLGLTPRRTIRVVGWTNEENGGRGGQAYRDAHTNELEKHIAAIESDGGTFKFRGFGFTGSDSAFAIEPDFQALQAVGRRLGERRRRRRRHRPDHGAWRPWPRPQCRRHPVLLVSPHRSRQRRQDRSEGARRERRGNGDHGVHPGRSPGAAPPEREAGGRSGTVG